MLLQWGIIIFGILGVFFIKTGYDDNEYRKKKFNEVKNDPIVSFEIKKYYAKIPGALIVGIILLLLAFLLFCSYIGGLKN